MRDHRRDHFLTGYKSMLEAARDHRNDESPSAMEHERRQEVIRGMLGRLNDRERKIIVSRFGLEGKAPRDRRGGKVRLAGFLTVSPEISARGQSGSRISVYSHWRRIGRRSHGGVLMASGPQFERGVHLVLSHLCSASGTRPRRAPGVRRRRNRAYRPTSEPLDGRCLLLGDPKFLAELTKGLPACWTNHDDMPHTVTSTSKPRILDSEALDTDDQFSHVFAEPGTYTYVCTVHPKMSGQVIVERR
jgi:hypothetical protein